MRWLALISAILLAAPAYADMFQDGSNAKLPEARQNLGAWPTVDAKQLGCKGDGVTDDTACIQAAVAKTGSPNIYFGPGTYLYGCGPYTWASAPMISGAGREVTKLKLVSGCTLPSGGTTGLFNSVSKTGGGWRDLTLDAAGAVQPGSGPGSTSALLRYSCTSDFMIDNVAIINIGDHSIGISAQTGGCVSKNWTVQNSYIHQVTQNPTLNSVAIAMGGIAPPADFQNIHISNNIILNSYVQVNGTNIHVTNNDISGWAFGTGIYQVEFTSKYHVITGNILHDSATTYDANGTPSGGIDLDGEHSIAANNICYNLGGWCIQVFGGYNLVSGNHSQNTNLAIPQNDRTRAPYQIVSNSGVGLISTGNLIQNNRDLGGAAQLYSFFERDAFGVDNVVKDNIFPLPVSLKNGTTTFIPGDADTVLLDATSNQTGLLSNTAYKPVGASLSAVSEIVAAPTLGAGP